jgi:hypothetical protein
MAQRLAFELNSEGVLVENTTFAPPKSEMVHSLYGEERNGWWHRATDRGDAIAASVDWKFGVPPLGRTPMPTKTIVVLIQKGVVMRTRPDGTTFHEIVQDVHDGWRPMVLQPIIWGDSPGISANVPSVPTRSVRVVGP